MGFWNTSLSFCSLFHKWKMSVHYINLSPLPVPSFKNTQKKYITVHRVLMCVCVGDIHCTLFIFCLSILWTCELKVWWENTLSMSYFRNLFMRHLKGCCHGTSHLQLNLIWFISIIFYFNLKNPFYLLYNAILICIIIVAFNC